MPGSTLNWSTVNIPRGLTYHLWAGVAVPAAGARLTIHTDGTPESVANPSAVHLGRSNEGATIRVGSTMEGSFSDEFSAPFRSQIAAEEMRISATLLQILDFNILQKLTPGSAKAAASGYEEMPFGGLTTFSTTSVALIAAMPEDATKFFVAHIYKTYNDAPVEFTIRRTQNGMTAVSFTGLSVETRTAGDQIGKLWKQVA